MSLKLNDYECLVCGHVFETMAYDDATVYCRKCGSYTKRLISVPGVNTANQDAEWIRSVREVVDKDGGPHCREFLKNPTRENLHTWMKVEGVRHFEQGEPIKPPPVDMERLTREVVMRDRERNRLEVRSDAV